MKICMACSMPLEHAEDIGLDNESGTFCKYCINEDSSVKTCEEIFNGGAQYFMGAVPNTDRDLAERLTRKNMKSLPYWQNKEHECLNGEEASEEEFNEAMSKMLV